MATTDPALMPHLGKFWNGVMTQNGPTRNHTANNGGMTGAAPINSTTASPKFSIRTPQIALASLGFRRK